MTRILASCSSVIGSKPWYSPTKADSSSREFTDKAAVGVDYGRRVTGCSHAAGPGRVHVVVYVLGQPGVDRIIGVQVVDRRCQGQDPSLTDETARWRTTLIMQRTQSRSHTRSRSSDSMLNSTTGSIPGS